MYITPSRVMRATTSYKNCRYMIKHLVAAMRDGWTHVASWVLLYKCDRNKKWENCTVMREGYYNSSLTGNLNWDVQTLECCVSAVFRLVAMMVACETPRQGGKLEWCVDLTGWLSCKVLYTCLFVLQYHFTCSSRSKKEILMWKPCLISLSFCSLWHSISS